MKNDDGFAGVRLPALADLRSMGGVHFYGIPSAEGDQDGFGSAEERSAAPGAKLGWGCKAVIANLQARAALVTTMGFHRYYFDLENGAALGAPKSDEYGHEGGARQDCERGRMLWMPDRGVWHELD